MKRIFALTLAVIFGWSVIAPQAQAAREIWQADLEDKMVWNTVTEFGTLLVGSKASLASYNPETGERMWFRDDMGRLAPFDVKEISGYPILIISQDRGIGGTKAIVQAISMASGEIIWQADTITGLPLGIYPVPGKPIALLFINEITNPENNGIYVYAFNVETGDILWKTLYADNANDIPLHLADNSGAFYVRTDLSGYHDPVFNGDFAYLSFAGLQQLDLTDGTIRWSVPFKPGNKNFKKAYAAPVVDGDTIYASGPGMVYAVNREDGSIKWKTDKIRSGLVAQMVNSPDMLVLRIGGNFWNPGTKAVQPDKPFQIAALNKADGKTLWEYEGAKGGITNFVYFPEYRSVFFADAKNLISIDTQSTGAVKEAFRLPVEFKRAIGAADVTSAGVKALTGGIGGMLRAGAKLAVGKEREDPPIAVIPQPNGTVVVRGQQHILSFDPKTQSTVWSATFDSPGASAIGMALVAAVSVVAVAGYQGQYAAGQSSMSSASNNIQGQFQRMDKYLDKRFSKTQSDERHAYILTNVTDNGESGIGIAAINLTTGETDNQVILDDKNPQYTVDEIGQTVYYFKKKKILAYSLE